MKGRGSLVLISGREVDRGVHKERSETISREMIGEMVVDTGGIGEIGEAEIVTMIGIETETEIGVEEKTEEVIAIGTVEQKWAVLVTSPD